DWSATRSRFRLVRASSREPTRWRRRGGASGAPEAPAAAPPTPLADAPPPRPPPGGRAAAPATPHPRAGGGGGEPLQPGRAGPLEPAQQLLDHQRVALGHGDDPPDGGVAGSRPAPGAGQLDGLLRRQRSQRQAGGGGTG